MGRGWETKGGCVWFTLSFLVKEKRETFLTDKRESYHTKCELIASVCCRFISAKDTHLNIAFLFSSSLPLSLHWGMTSMPRILCTVRALHPFHSPEQSSLSFEKGDFIDVLAQLESGWWDGW